MESGTAENVRIAVPKAQSKSVFYGEYKYSEMVCKPIELSFGHLPRIKDDDSGSDEDVMTREAMKKNTQALVDAKTKKKPDDEEETGTKKRKR